MRRPGDGSKIYDPIGLEFWQRTLLKRDEPLIGPLAAYTTLELEKYNIGSLGGGTLKSAGSYQWYAQVSLPWWLLIGVWEGKMEGLMVFV